MLLSGCLCWFPASWNARRIRSPPSAAYPSTAVHCGAGAEGSDGGHRPGGRPGEREQRVESDAQAHAAFRTPSHAPHWPTGHPTGHPQVRPAAAAPAPNTAAAAAASQDFFTKEVAINDAPTAARAQLTKRSVQEDIQARTHTVIVTKGEVFFSVLGWAVGWADAEVCNRSQYSGTAGGQQGLNRAVRA